MTWAGDTSIHPVIKAYCSGGDDISRAQIACRDEVVAQWVPIYRKIGTLARGKLVGTLGEPLTANSSKKFNIRIVYSKRGLFTLVAVLGDGEDGNGGKLHCNFPQKVSFSPCDSVVVAPLNAN